MSGALRGRDRVCREGLEGSTHLAVEHAGDALGEDVGVGAHAGCEPLGDMAEDGEGEVVGDERAVVFGDGQVGTMLIDDGFHDGA